MLSKGEKNYLIGVPLFITGLLCLISGIILHIRPDFSVYYLKYMRSLHIWIGYVLAVVIVFHLLMHSGWISTTTKKLFSDKKKTAILVGIIVITMIACYMSAVWGPQPQHGGKNRGMNKGYLHNQSNKHSSFAN